MTRLPVTALRLIAITDGMAGGADELVARCLAAVAGGATCVQLRLKGEPARVIAAIAERLVRAVPAPVIVNDRFDVALASGAAGVHVGADDIAVRDVRRCVPPGFVIGTSVGCDAEVANARDGADYVGIGPVFATGSKGDAGPAIGIAEVARLRTLAGLPSVAIGGISAANASEAISAGVDGVAVLSAIFSAGQTDAAAAARALSRAIGS